MPNSTTNSQERTARHVYHDAQFLFRDTTGTHYWSTYHQAIVAVAADGSTDTLDFAADNTLSEYAQAVRSKRGLETTPRIVGSLVTEIAAAVDA